jgi:hypothetical protein
VFIGTPDSVIWQLSGFQNDLGLDDVLIELNCGGKIPYARMMSAVQLLCQEAQSRFH